MAQKLIVIKKSDINNTIKQLKYENNRLSKELSLAQKYKQLFESYRNCLNSFNNSCVCVENIENKLVFNELENQYKSVSNNENNEEIVFSDNLINENIVFDSNKRIIELNKVIKQEPIDSLEKNSNLNKLRSNTNKRQTRIYSKKASKAVLKRAQTKAHLFACNECNQKFITRDLLVSHKKSFHCILLYKCLKCNKICEWIENTNKTVSINIEFIQKTLKSKTCQKCGETLVQQLVKKTEIGLKSLEKPVIDQKTTSNEKPNNDIIDDMMNNLNESSLDLNELLKSDRNADSVHLNKTKPQTIQNKDFKCNECEKSFKREMYLKKHKLIIHSSKEYLEEVNQYFGTIHSTVQYTDPKNDLNESSLELNELLKSDRNADSVELNKTKSQTIQNKDFKCNECEKYFKSEIYLKKHKTIIHSSKEYLEEVNQYFGTIHSTVQLYNYYTVPKMKTIAKTKMEKIREKYYYYCAFENCSFKTPSKNTLEAHKNAIHLNNKLECNECKRIFYNALNLRNHMKNFHLPKDKNYKCDQMGCDFATSYKKNLRDHKLTHGLKLVKCEWNDCESVFHTRQLMKLHIKCTHQKQRPYACEWPGCEYSGSDSYRIRIHRRIHTNEKPILCDWPECGQTFSCKPALRSHLLSHKDSRDFECVWPECGKRFRRNYHLKMHLLTHQKDKRLECQFPYCKRSFVDKSTLMRHLKTH